MTCPNCRAAEERAAQAERELDVSFKQLAANTARIERLTVALEMAVAHNSGGAHVRDCAFLDGGDLLCDCWLPTAIAALGAAPKEASKASAPKGPTEALSESCGAQGEEK